MIISPKVIQCGNGAHRLLTTVFPIFKTVNGDTYLMNGNVVEVPFMQAITGKWWRRSLKGAC